MLRLKIVTADDQRLRRHLLRGREADEEAAFLVAAVREHAVGIDFLVREVITVPDEALLSKGRAGLEIDPVFISTVLKRARIEELSIFMCHSHPFTDDGVRFSSIDDAGEAALFPRFVAQVPTRAHGAIVFGQQSRDARVWLQGEPRQVRLDEIVIVGDVIEIVTPTRAAPVRTPLAIDQAVARQVLALGERGNAKLSSLRVGVIGAGGVGSVIHDGLVRLGVSAIVLVDGDKLTTSNVSREENATLADVGEYKVEVLRAAAARIGFGNDVRVVAKWLHDPDAVNALLDCDAIVLATDTMKSRVLAARLGAQYLIPIVSVGIDVVPGEAGAIASIGGHVAVQYPDGPCLDCLGLIDHELLAREEMSREARVANPYIRGRDPDASAPSVFVLNQVVGGAVGIELLQLATGALRPLGPRTYLVFDGCSGELRRVVAKAVRACEVCKQVRACGDRFSLPM